eukprot:COSAG01_NODE_4802_length_4734_cov_2.711111_4_plen_288_part_00
MGINHIIARRAGKLQRRIEDRADAVRENQRSRRRGGRDGAGHGEAGAGEDDIDLTYTKRISDRTRTRVEMMQASRRRAHAVAGTGAGAGGGGEASAPQLGGAAAEQNDPVAAWARKHAPLAGGGGELAERQENLTAATATKLSIGERMKLLRAEGAAQGEAAMTRQRAATADESAALAASGRLVAGPEPRPKMRGGVWERLYREPVERMLLVSSRRTRTSPTPSPSAGHIVNRRRVTVSRPRAFGWWDGAAGEGAAGEGRGGEASAGAALALVPAQPRPGSVRLGAL